MSEKEIQMTSSEAYGMPSNSCREFGHVTRTNDHHGDNATTNSPNMSPSNRVSGTTDSSMSGPVPYQVTVLMT